MNTEQALRERAEAMPNWKDRLRYAIDCSDLFPSDSSRITEFLTNWIEQETKTVECYVPVEIKEGCEMPEKQGRYGVIRKNGEMSSRYYYGGIKEFNNQESLSHWLKKTTIKAISK